MTLPTLDRTCQHEAHAIVDDHKWLARGAANQSGTDTATCFMMHAGVSKCCKSATDATTCYVSERDAMTRFESELVFGGMLRGKGECGQTLCFECGRGDMLYDENSYGT